MRMIGLEEHFAIPEVFEGADHILMATDYTFAKTPKGIARTFLEEAELNESDRQQIASGNWKSLCADIRR